MMKLYHIAIEIFVLILIIYEFFECYMTFFPLRFTFLNIQFRRFWAPLWASTHYDEGGGKSPDCQLDGVSVYIPSMNNK